LELCREGRLTGGDVGQHLGQYRLEELRTLLISREGRLLLWLAVLLDAGLNHLRDLSPFATSSVLAGAACCSA